MCLCLCGHCFANYSIRDQVSGPQTHKHTLTDKSAETNCVIFFRTDCSIIKQGGGDFSQALNKAGAALNDHLLMINDETVTFLL